MAQNPPTYRRLPGTGYQYAIPAWGIFLLFFVIGIFALLFRGRRFQLWQGEEHLLLVQWDGAREYYKRFDYRDIQAIVIRKTREGLAFNIVLSTFTCLLAGFAIAASDFATRIVFLVLAGLVGLILLANSLAGPTCRCFIRTAVQTEPLPSLSRLKRARQVLARVRPLLVAAQGPLAPEDIPARIQRWKEAKTGTPQSTTSDLTASPTLPL